jgi:heme exporter protein A
MFSVSDFCFTMVVTKALSGLFSASCYTQSKFEHLQGSIAFYWAARMKSNSLVMESLVVARDGVPLTPPISMALAGGEMLAIHGANGSGKSTLLKTVAGLIPIYQGSIRVNDAWPAPLRPLYIGHKRGLSPDMSVHDNVSFWARAYGYPELTAAAMHYFDLEDIPHAKVNELSAGWQQRVALTRLITMPCAMWLLDEPMANLDAEGMALLQSLIQSRIEQGGIILIATHMLLQGERIKSMNINAINE